MASKKNHKSGPSDKVVNKVLKGTPVMVANSGALWTCPVCATQRKRGIIYRQAGTDYCSRKCIPE